MAAINLDKTINSLRQDQTINGVRRKGWDSKMLSKFVTSLENRGLIRTVNGKKVVDDLWEHAGTFKSQHSSDGVSAP